MKVLELFAGTRSIGKAFEVRGHEVFSVEWDKNFEDIDLYADILTVTAEEIIRKFGKPDVIWASPDCTTFSIAAISHHRRKNPETDILETTGCSRTGCIFCMFGCHLEKEPNRFQRLKETHPRQYEYCIGGGEMVDGKWQPNKEGLGLGHVLDYIGVKYD